MNILRKPPYPLTVSYTVPDANTEYIVVIKDSSRNDVEGDIVATSDANSILDITLTDFFSQYDDSYALTVYESVDGEEGDIVVEDNLNIARPYVDPATLGTTATEIAEYTKYEFLARSLIDSITGGFYYTFTWIDTVGQNTDFLSVWDRVYKILEVYENNELVWDSAQTPSALKEWNYLITKDKSAIIKDPVQNMDRYQFLVGNPVGVDLAISDSFAIFDTEDSGNVFAVKPGVTFPMGWNYTLLLETGYTVVPYDIQEATKMLIDDIKCGKLEYFKKYITSYSTDQYRIQIDKSAFEGTGNILVDKILEKYITNIKKPGVL